MSKPTIITGENNQLLKQKSTAVNLKEGKKIANLLQQSVTKEQALGIAAPQIGINKRVILVKINDQFKVMINPEITHFSQATEINEEGCLSLPECWLPVERSKEIIVSFQDPRGQKHSLKLNGLSGRIVQHEVDHLEGVLITDRQVKEKVRLRPLEVIASNNS
jgi:peptide deformylase